MNREKAAAIAKAYIEKEHALGESAGGSGHLGYTSLREVSFGSIEKQVVGSMSCWKLSFRYTLVTETEFTYYPDSPPRTSMYEKEIIVDEEGKIIENPCKE